jgi:hypothetical protein
MVSASCWKLMSLVVCFTLQLQQLRCTHHNHSAPEWSASTTCYNNQLHTFCLACSTVSFGKKAAHLLQRLLQNGQLASLLQLQSTACLLHHQTAAPLLRGPGPVVLMLQKVEKRLDG